MKTDKDYGHTPGPWRWEGRWLISGDKKVLDIDTVDTSEADSSLIAASPELLDIAYDYLALLRELPDEDEATERALAKTLEVIIKAKGRGKP